MKIVVLFAFLFSASLTAGDVEVVFKFDKKPPHVALVYFSEDTSLKGNSQPILDQKDKAFSELLVIGSPNTSLKITNSDILDHNVFASDQDAGAEFDIGLAPPGSTREKEIDWKEDAVIRVGCKIHPKMRAYVANISSKYHKVVEFDRAKTEANATVTGPAQLKKIRIWLPRYEPIEVELSEGEQREVELKKRGKVYGKVVLSR